MQKTQFLVIGSGIAGLTAAHMLSSKGDVLVLTKGQLKEANTYWAQGGIAAVMDKDDSFESHIKDTLEAGSRHNDEKAVRTLVENGPKAIRFLEEIGVKFNPEPALEGGHSRPRVWNTSDFTGRDILNQLIRTVKKNKAIRVLEETEVLQLIVEQGHCRGVWTREPVLAGHTVLATGGLGQLFGRTTNTVGSGGDGIAMAVLAGLEMRDLEFMQFHPTAFAKPDNGRYFLLSEALRGFGARVLNHRGEPFLHQFHAKAELAPRDVLARAVFFELMNGPVYLSMHHLKEADVREHFYNIYKRMKDYGYDLTADLIPITPVAHYACGGVPVNLKGETALPGLLAVGEVARTGVHGANRLASNSLLEAVVFARHLAEAVIPADPPDEKTLEMMPPAACFEPIPQVKAYARRLGEIMWKRAGIVRTEADLRAAQEEIMAIPSKDIRFQRRRLVCSKIIEACLARPESLGCHYMAANL